MRSGTFRHSFATLMLSAVTLASLTGCPGAEQDTGPNTADGKGGSNDGTNRDPGGAAGASPGGGGEPGGAGVGGSVGTGSPDPDSVAPPSTSNSGFENDGASGEAGASATSPSTGGASNGVPCVGKYELDAIWPAAGRCSARSSASALEGPSNFSQLRRVALQEPIRTSPVIAADGSVWVTNNKGLWSVDPNLANTPTGPVDTFASQSSPVVLADSSVVYLTTDGQLRRCVAGGACESMDFTRNGGDNAATGWRSDLAVSPEGDIWFTSPAGFVYRVTPSADAGPPATRSFQVPFTNSESGPPGAVTTGVTISPASRIFFGTSQGVAMIDHSGDVDAKPQLFASAAVSSPPVFVAGKGAIYADAAGLVHTISIDPTGKVDSALGAGTLGGAPGGVAASGTSEPTLFLGVGTLLRGLSTSDEAANVDQSLDQRLASGPILAAPASDPSERLFVPATDGNLFFLAPKAPGESIPEQQDSYLTEGALEAGVALAGHRVYFGSTDGSLYLIADDTVILDAQNGTGAGEPTP